MTWNASSEYRYVSSDFGNHPLSHLMGSVFGMHDRENVEVCKSGLLSKPLFCLKFYKLSLWAFALLEDYICSRFSAML